MKNLARILIALALLAQSARANTYQWTNTLGGSWLGTTNWSPNGVPSGTDSAFITNAGTYTVLLNTSATLNLPTLVVGGGDGTQTLALDGNGTFNLTGAETIAPNGQLLVSNVWMNGALLIQNGGQFQIAGSAAKEFYSLSVTNQGIMTWSGGSIVTGGSLGTQIYNSGLFLITGDNSTGYGGGGGALLLNNSGLVQKAGGTGTTSLGLPLVNQPGGEVDAEAGTLVLGGSSGSVAGSFVGNLPGKMVIAGGTWTDAGGTFSGTATNTFSSGTFNLRTNPPPGLQFAGGDLYITGATTFQNNGAITNLTLDGATLHGTNFVGGGTLTMNSGSIPDRLVVLTNGQFVAGASGSKLLYGLTIINQGTVTCNGGVSVGGTTISNGGLWQMTGDYNVAYGGGAIPVWTNAGILRKTAGGSGYSQMDGSFVNLPGALVDNQAGHLIFAVSTFGQIGGTFKATGLTDFNGGTWTDAGGVATGAGTNRLNGATLNLRTNMVPGLLLAVGTVNITGTNTFQNAGAITNLVLDGVTLAGTNAVDGGTLAMNSGSLAGQLTVKPAGGLALQGSAGKSLASTFLINQGMVSLSGTGLSMGNNVISNGGLWRITGDYGFAYSGGTIPVFTNSGTLEKSAGSGTAVNTVMYFYNQTGALVQVDSGTLQLPTGSTNFAGTLRLNGGTLNANGNLAVAGGTLDGTGTVGASVFTGGTISPGTNGAGGMIFPSGLNLSSNVTLVIDGSGPVPGTMYDQISVTGTVALASCNLQVAALPGVPAGTTFKIIANNGGSPVSGTFAGLPENAPLTVGAQTFRIHYAGGSGRDVTLVRDGVVVGPLLSVQGITNGASYFSGSGAIPLTAFTVRASTNLINWTNIGVATSSVSGGWSFIDTNAWRYTQRFYGSTN